MTRSSRHLRLALVTAVLAACAKDGITSGDLEGFGIQLAAADIWQGAEIVITSPVLAQFDSLTALIDGDTLSHALLRRVDSVTVAVRLSVAAGSHQVALRTARGTSAPAVIAVYGYVDRVFPGPTLGGLQPLLGSVPVAFASASGGMARVDFRFPNLVQIVDTMLDPTCLGDGVGPSVVTGVVTFVSRAASGCGVLRARSYGSGPGGVDVDSGPAITNLGAAAHVGTGQWLILRFGAAARVVRGAGGTYTTTSVNGVGGDALVVSPRGDRALAVLGGGSTSVLDLPSGLVAYTLAGTVYSALFSPGGDTLYASVGGRLCRFDATTGAILDSLPGGLVQADALALDPGGPWLYLASGYSLQVSVIDRRTWQLVATMGGGCGDCNFDVTLLVSASERKLYLIAHGSAVPGRTVLDRFTLVP